MSLADPNFLHFSKFFFTYFPISTKLIIESIKYKTFVLFHVFILQTYALLVTLKGFPVFEIRKNLGLRKIRLYLLLNLNVEAEIQICKVIYLSYSHLGSWGYSYSLYWLDEKLPLEVTLHFSIVTLGSTKPVLEWSLFPLLFDSIEIITRFVQTITFRAHSSVFLRLFFCLTAYKLRIIIATPNTTTVGIMIFQMRYGSEESGVVVLSISASVTTLTHPQEASVP